MPTYISFDENTGAIKVLDDRAFGAYDVIAKRRADHRNDDACVHSARLSVVRLRLSGNRTGGFMYTAPDLKRWALVVREKSSNGFIGSVQGAGTIRMDDSALGGIQVRTRAVDQNGVQLGKDWTAVVGAHVTASGVTVTINTAFNTTCQASGFPSGSTIVIIANTGTQEIRIGVGQINGNAASVRCLIRTGTPGQQIRLYAQAEPFIYSPTITVRTVNP